MKSYLLVLVTGLILCSPLHSIESEQLHIPYNHPHVYYEGRIGENGEQGAAEIYWPGSFVSLKFNGTSLNASLEDQHGENYFNVIVDGIHVAVLFLSGEKKEYVLARNLPEGVHTLELHKRNDWTYGWTRFYGFEVTGSYTLPAESKELFIEFYGNSITTGYGNEDFTGEDKPTGDVTNNYKAYGSITARKLGAEYSCISHSGIGILVSWHDLIMSEEYDRLNPADSISRWDFSSKQPDVVVINLFQNDSWLTEMPGYEQFKIRFGETAPTESQIVNAYVDFLNTIRGHYPESEIICLLGNMDITRAGSPWPGYVTRAVEKFDGDVHTLFVPYKNSPGHPKEDEQKIIADALTDYILSHGLAGGKQQGLALPGPPNIVIIYADDMGYGDLNCQNPDSKIPTPNLDQLAAEGMRFTDAHSSSGICSPSRFALLTGSYHWRRQHHIVDAFGPPFFRDSDITLPQVLKEKNYSTACIGKWHLGWDWDFLNEPGGEVKQWGKKRSYYRPEDVDMSGAIPGGPLDRGFDYYFGDGTINFPPYAWVENDRLPELPTREQNIHDPGFLTKEGEWEFRPGPMVEGWNPYRVLPTLTEKAVEWIRNRQGDQPFFLYFALPSPHAPIIPNEKFLGKSEAGGYGDFVFQTDWVAGQVLKALKEQGFEENTLVIFSSDNGPEMYAFKRAENYEHFSMGDFRGLKRDVWEGGHHIPFIMKWPGMIEAGSVSHEVISQVDLMATLAAITNAELPQEAAPDSYNLLPVIRGEKYNSPLREATVHNTYKEKWGLRQGKWLYINQPSGEHTKMPAYFRKMRGYEDFSTEGLLFDMEKDAEQQINLYDRHPEIIKEMENLLQLYREQGYSVSRNK